MLETSDIALPCAACKNEINGEAAKRLAAQGVICIWRWQHDLIDSYQKLLQRKWYCRPAKAANAGVVQPFQPLKWAKQSSPSWTREEVDGRLKDIIATNIFQYS